jgi:hypothetical protein
MNEVAELLAVARAPAGVGVENDIAGRGVKLDLSREAVSVVGEGAVVNLENERVLLFGIESGRFADPSLNLSSA